MRTVERARSSARCSSLQKLDSKAVAGHFTRRELLLRRSIVVQLAAARSRSSRPQLLELLDHSRPDQREHREACHEHRVQSCSLLLWSPPSNERRRHVQSKLQHESGRVSTSAGRESRGRSRLIRDKAPPARLRAVLVSVQRAQIGLSGRMRPRAMA